MDINLSCKNADIDAGTNRIINVGLTSVDENELMDLLTVEQIISHFSTSELLDAIGREECADYFDLI